MKLSDGIAVESKFEVMGARAEVTQLASPKRRGRRWNGAVSEFADLADDGRSVLIDIQTDERGAYFSIARRHDVRVRVMDVRPIDRHLVLDVFDRAPGAVGGGWSQFLCGFDERAWFVAAIPETTRAQTVQDGKDALKPPEVWEAIREFGVRPQDRDKRRTRGFVRQGEWFFIPSPSLVVDEDEVLHKEKISRGRAGSKSHVCEYLFREEVGEEVWVCAAYPQGLSQDEYRKLSREERMKHNWDFMMRGARAYARGHVWHADHEPVWLEGWHQIVMNTESQAQAMRHVIFLD